MPAQRVKDPDDDRRCIGQDAKGEQCWYITEDGHDRCCVCGPRPDDRDDHADYLAEQFKRRMRIECDDDDPVKLLRDNLMDINAMIASHRNKITDESSLLSNSGALTDLIMKAEKVTVTLHRLSITSGLLLARPALIRWGQSIVEAVTVVIRDKYTGWEDDLIDLSDTIANIIVSTKNEEGEKPGAVG